MVSRMINPHAEPIAHVSPYKRIELGSRDKKPEPKWVPQIVIPPLTETIEWDSSHNYVGWTHLKVGDSPPWGEDLIAVGSTDPNSVSYATYDECTDAWFETAALARRATELLEASNNGSVGSTSDEFPPAICASHNALWQKLARK